MDDMRISDMMARQRALHARHTHDWSPVEPAWGKDSLLWLVEELGETIAIIKKKGPSAVMEDESVRAHFCEEMSDVLMYWTDALLCFGVTPEEITAAFEAKSDRNLTRDFAADDARLYVKKPE